MGRAATTVGLRVQVMVSVWTRTLLSASGRVLVSGARQVCRWAGKERASPVARQSLPDQTAIQENFVQCLATRTAPLVDSSKRNARPTCWAACVVLLSRGELCDKKRELRLSASNVAKGILSDEKLEIVM
jgi:hypothetical protein